MQRHDVACPLESDLKWQHKQLFLKTERRNEELLQQIYHLVLEQSRKNSLSRTQHFLQDCMCKMTTHICASVQTDYSSQDTLRVASDPKRQADSGDYSQPKLLSLRLAYRQSCSICFTKAHLRSFNLVIRALITKTRLFKYIENFTTKNWRFSDKNSHIFHISAQKHTLWVLVRTASSRRF